MTINKILTTDSSTSTHQLEIADYKIDNILINRSFCREKEKEWARERERQKK